MLRQPIKFVDHNGTARETVLYFDLTEIEVIEWELEAEEQGGLETVLQSAVDSDNRRELLAFIKDLVTRSYGIKSEDGTQFEKDPAHVKTLMASPFWSTFLLSLFENNGAKGANFITKVLPASMIKSAGASISGSETGYQPNAKEQFDMRQRAKNIPEPTLEVNPERNWSPSNAQIQEEPAYSEAPTPELNPYGALPSDENRVVENPGSIQASGQDMTEKELAEWLEYKRSKLSSPNEIGRPAHEG